MEPKKSFILKRIESIGFALRGAYLLIKTEASIKVQFIIAIMMVILGFYFELSATEWALQVLAMGLVLSIEGINTAIEKMADFIHPNTHKKIGLIKDISAGAVLIASLFAGIVGLIIYIPKILERY